MPVTSLTNATRSPAKLFGDLGPAPPVVAPAASPPAPSVRLAAGPSSLCKPVKSWCAPTTSWSIASMTMAALWPYCACCTRPAGGEASGRENVCSGPALNRQVVIDLGLHAVGRNQAVCRGLHALSATGLRAKNSAPGSIIRPA